MSSSYRFSKLFLTLFTILLRCRGNDFDPYVMNGGLVTAVAGRDYMIMATDTRLTGSSGYDILERYHINSRVWAPVAPSTGATGDDLIAPDGSLNVNLRDELQKRQQQQQQHRSSSSSSFFSSSSSPPSSSSSSLIQIRESAIDSQHQTSNSPILIGSVGCQADCEKLKRLLRSELRVAMHFGEISIHDSTGIGGHNDFSASALTTTAIPVETMSVLLSQILYSRRTFPFGCYCILGGMSFDGMGQVYVYDAIGSYEQLAIACTGTGFELLQPILDRQFNPLIPSSFATSPQHGRKILRPASLQVDCPTVEQAIQILVSAYRSVAEREIGVGDHVVFYSIQRIPEQTMNEDQKECESNQNEAHGSNENNDIPTPKHIYQSKIWTAPLKKH